MEKTLVKIRCAKSSDINNLIFLLGELDRPVPKDRYENNRFEILLKRYIQGTASKGGRGIVLATSHSKIIGMVSFVLLDRLDQRMQEFWIPDLIVSQEYRNQGIGGLLMNKCEKIAKIKQCYRIRLESRNDRFRSHGFYKKMGFRQNALVFEKVIK
jgi:ribosomal protein S18 acetylase RimI-like enzyme